MGEKWRTLIAVCFGTYMATMDFSIVNIALPTLSRVFDSPPNTVVWATLTSSLVVTGLTLTVGRLGDLFGRRRLYVAGWVIFTIGMAVASLAQSITQLIAIRAFQGVGVSMAIANGNALVTGAFPAHERGRALGITGSVVGAGLMSGPIIGGFVLAAFDWQAIFYLRVPIGIAAATMAILWIRETLGQSGQRRLDLPGSVTLFLALAGLLLAINRGQSWGWTSPAILGLFALGAASLIAFIWIESHEPSPVVQLSLFKVRVYAASVLSLILNFAGQSAVTFLLPFYLIRVLGYSTARAGLTLATVPIMMLILSSGSGYLADRYGFRYQSALGATLVTAGLLLLAGLGLDTSMAMVMLRLSLIGVGTALFMAPNSVAIMSSVPRTMLGTASATVATARNVGNATALAMAGAIMTAVASASAGVSGVRADQLPPAALLDGIRTAFLVAGCVSSLAIIASSLRGRVVRVAEPAEAMSVDSRPVAAR